MERLFLALSAINGFLAVGLGAFGAHGLRARLGSLSDGAQRLGWWETAAHYHLLHALALGLVSQLAARGQAAWVQSAGYCFLAGIVLFSGSLYTMTLTGVRVLGAVTPLGGLGLLAGWASLLVVAIKLRAS